MRKWLIRRKCRLPNQTNDNKDGASVITMFFIALLTITVVFAMASYFSYEMNQNRFITITSRTMDKVLVKGQLTNADRNEMYEALATIGMTDQSRVLITGSPVEAFDVSDATYAKRGQSITMTVIYDKPHFIANMVSILNPGADKSRYRIGHRMEGMSEKW